MEVINPKPKELPRELAVEQPRSRWHQLIGHDNP